VEGIKERNDEARFRFIITELDLALTFYDIARSSENGAKAERNLAHARTAYQGAMRFLKDANLTAKMRADIEERLNKLAPIIEKPKSAQPEP
jgi:hypothetical protein